MADFKDFLSTDGYLARLTRLNEIKTALAQWLSVGTHSNVPDGAIRWSQSQKRWEVYSGGTWGALETEYNVNVNQLKGAVPNTAVSNNTIVKRTAQGGIKAAAPSVNDEVTPRSYADARYVRQDDLGKDGGLTVENAKNADNVGGLVPQESVTDATEDRLMRVGAFGLGVDLNPNYGGQVVTDFDDIALAQTGFIQGESNMTGWGQTHGPALLVRRHSGRQWVLQAGGGREWGGERKDDLKFNVSSLGSSTQGPDWEGWQTIYHTGNISDAKSGDSAKLDGKEASYYRNADNINAGTLNNARLPAAVALSGASGGVKEAGSINAKKFYEDGEEFGVDRKIWYDMTDSRSKNVWYENSLDYPIDVSITGYKSAGSGQISIRQGPSGTIMKIGGVDNYGSTVSFTLPPGWRCRADSELTDLNRWMERR